MKESLIDLSVLLVFFNRPATFKKVFDRIKEVRPARLFLYQDGARENRPDDIENVKKCREIANDIDWECEVHTLFQEKNMGVDPSGYLADRWAFSQTDKCLVIEDDVIPSVSYFYFCKEMLDKYENDDRIMLISGMNLEEKTKVDSDYFFSKTTITMAWGSWSRVVNKWDGKYSFLDDDSKVKYLKDYIKTNKLEKRMMKKFYSHRDSGIEHFETVLISNQYLNDGLTIVPSKNMAINIGAVPGSSHSESELRFVARGYRRIFTMNTYDIDTDSIKHPTEVKDYKPYKKEVFYVHGWNRPLLRMLRFSEVCIKKIFCGRFKEVIRDIKVRLK